MAEPSVDDPFPAQIPAPPAVGEYLDDPNRVLRQKVKILKWISLLDAISYACLLVPMYMKWIQDNHSDNVYVAIRFIGFWHGLIWIAYTFMTIDLHRFLRWSRQFLVLAIIPPIVGGLVCHFRLRRESVPAV